MKNKSIEQPENRGISYFNSNSICVMNFHMREERLSITLKGLISLIACDSQLKLSRNQVINRDFACEVTMQRLVNYISKNYI